MIFLIFMIDSTPKSIFYRKGHKESARFAKNKFLVFK